MGLDIGGTKCAASVLRGEEVVEIARIPTGSYLETLTQLRQALQKERDARPLVIGISCGGPLDAQAGRIGTPPNLPPDWHSMPICEQLSANFGGPVWIMNDANACALAEWRFGAGRGCDHLIFLTAGTGFGAGLILNGELYAGASGDAGEIGHVRLDPDGPVGYGKAGSVEGFCSGGGIARQLEHDYSIAALNAKALAEAAHAGDPAAISQWRKIGTRWGEAVAILTDLFNPQRLVIGGLYPRCDDLLRESLEAALQREVLPGSLRTLEIVPAVLGETIGSHGAVCTALHHLVREGTALFSQPAPNDHFTVLVENHPRLDVCRPAVEAAFVQLCETIVNGGKLLLCGNGGSAADADHIVGELMKGFLLRRPLATDEQERLVSLWGDDGRHLAEHLQGAIPAISLCSHAALSTAFANDVAPQLVFAQQVQGYGRSGDNPRGHQHLRSFRKRAASPASGQGSRFAHHWAHRH